MRKWPGTLLVVEHMKISIWATVDSWLDARVLPCYTQSILRAYDAEEMHSMELGGCSLLLAKLVPLSSVSCHGSLGLGIGFKSAGGPPSSGVCESCDAMPSHPKSQPLRTVPLQPIFGSGYFSICTCVHCGDIACMLRRLLSVFRLHGMSLDGRPSPS